MDKNYPARNACDARKANGYCVNNFNHYDPKYTLIFRDDRNDFDFCHDCLKLEVFVDEFLAKNFDWAEWLQLPKN